MPSQTREHYLKIIYKLINSGDKVTTTALAKLLGVSNSTASNMVKELGNQGWLEYQPYQPISLTAEGHAKAGSVIRKHRLTEMFLVEVMGFGWDEVHDIAEEMEHLDSPALFDRMDAMLDSPVADPHGSPIPDRQGNTQKRNLKLASVCQVGEVVVLKAVRDGHPDLLRLLDEKQIGLETQLTIRKIETYDRSIYVDYDEHSSVMLSHEVCQALLVQSAS